MSYFLTRRFRRVWANWLKRSGCPSSSLILPPPHPPRIILGCSEFSTSYFCDSFVSSATPLERQIQNGSCAKSKMMNNFLLQYLTKRLSISTYKRKPVLINKFQPGPFQTFYGMRNISPNFFSTSCIILLLSFILILFCPLTTEISCESQTRLMSLFET
jgi:hypothetical protein